MYFQLGTFAGGKAFPVEFDRNIQLAVVRRLAVFIGHFQEQQVGELLQVIAVSNAYIAEGIAEGPDFGDYGGGVVTHKL